MLQYVVISSNEKYLKYVAAYAALAKVFYLQLFYISAELGNAGIIPVLG
jgi:hypothetical protein